ncbi:hypothetical protein N9L06_07445 [Mariniblastus sp.]|nr:hypothetical protein [Mariniblastus sp.]
MKTLLKCVVALAAVAAMAVFAMSFVPNSVCYGYDVTYLKAPDSDNELKDWIIAQPNVVEHTVHVNRRNRRNNQKLEVAAIVCQNWWHVRPFKALDQQCAKFGYELAGPFAISP